MDQHVPETIQQQHDQLRDKQLSFSLPVVILGSSSPNLEKKYGELRQNICLTLSKLV